MSFFVLDFAPSIEEQRQYLSSTDHIIFTICWYSMCYHTLITSLELRSSYLTKRIYIYHAVYIGYHYMIEAMTHFFDSAKITRLKIQRNPAATMCIVL